MFGNIDNVQVRNRCLAVKLFNDRIQLVLGTNSQLFKVGLPRWLHLLQLNGTSEE